MWRCLRRTNEPEALLNLNVRVSEDMVRGPLPEDSPLSDTLNRLLHDSGLVEAHHAKARQYFEGERHVGPDGRIYPGHVEGAPTTDAVLELGEVGRTHTHLHGTDLGIIELRHGTLVDADMRAVKSYAQEKVTEGN